MSSSTATISSKTSSINTNDRKRSIRSSPSPPLTKRNGLSTTSDQSRKRSDRISRSKQRSSSTDSNHSTTSFDSNEILPRKKAHLNSKSLPINYDSEEDFEQTKINSNQTLSKTNSMLVSSTVSKKDNVIIQQLTKPHIHSNSSTKLVKFVVPQSTSSIKMLSSDDGFTSALRIPTKIQLTKPLRMSSTKTDTISQEQTNHQDKQQTVSEYHSSTTLPPTPPPPIIDHSNANIQMIEQQNQEEEEEDDDDDDDDDEQQQQQNNNDDDEKEENLINNNQKNDSTNIEQESNSTRHVLRTQLSDWSVPPTSELSPRSLTSSSPDLTQQILPVDDALADFDCSNQYSQPVQRRFRSLSPYSMSDFQRKNEQIHKSKSLTRLSNENKRTLTLHQSAKKRRRHNQHLILQQKNTKANSDDQFIIRLLLDETIERIVSINNEQDNALKTLLIKPTSETQHKIQIDRQIKPTNSKKTSECEFRSMVLTEKKLDELAFLLHANNQRSEYERMDNPAKVEERMREIWSQMSNQKKNSYYKRVIQIYKRPNREVVITSSTAELNPLDSMNNSSPISSIEYKRQTSTPLSFHSVASSTSDESLQQNIFVDIVTELIQGAKGLDKLSCSLATFSDSIQNFVQSTIEQRTQMLTNLEQQVEKKYSTQLNRANLFCKQKIQYFATKHQINSSDQLMNELTLIVKYFYLFVLSLNCQKQQVDFETFVKDLVQGNRISFDESFQSNVLTNIIDNFILCSSLAHEYLAAQDLIINQVEYSLPSVKNVELENDLLTKNDHFFTTNPFVDVNDLENYLNRCEHTTTNIPTYPNQSSQHPSIYYPAYQPPPPPYYYPTPDMNNYYYNPSPMYSTYPYGQTNNNNYYHHPTPTNSNEQMKYYYNHHQQQIQYPYANQTNSTNDIPVVQRSYRPMNPNLQRPYSNSQMPTTSSGPLPPSTPAMFDPSTVVASQSPSSTPAIET